MEKNFKRTKHTCYYTYLAMSSIFSLPPLLFVTFREMYGISYTLLGTLVLVNFSTQFLVDLIFTMFTKYFNIHKTVRTMPLLTFLGLIIYALVPMVAPDFAYIGLVTGTLVFSVAAGLCEVLLSPVVAALPSENPERDMSILHSLYAYGVVMVVIVSTIVLNIIGRQNWMYLAMFWAFLPVLSFVFFCISPIPDMDISHTAGAGKSKKKTYGLALCTLCIFLGSATENTMTNWISGYVENALHISKSYGDIIGMTSFAVLLGLTRSWYAKYGKNIMSFLMFGMIGSVICYLIAGLGTNPVLCMIACVFTGIFTSMLWPGTLIMMEEKISGVGVTAYALMAAGGDFGASVSPQMMGIVVDKVAVSSFAADMAAKTSLVPEQIGMKVGMLISVSFPLLGIVLLLYMKRFFNKNNI